MKDEDDSGDEAEARHLLEKRREQAKYDAVRGDSEDSVAEKAAEPGLMDSMLRCLITPPQPVDRRRSTMAAAGVPDRMVEPSPYDFFPEFFGHPTKTGVTRHEGSPRLRAIVTGPSRRVLLISPRVWRVCPVNRKL